MATTLSFKNDDDQDERLNPAGLKSREEQAAFDNIANNFDKTADDTQENDNIAKARAAEEGVSESGWKTNVASGGKKEKTDLKGQVRKKGPIALIISIVLGTGGVSLFFTAPGLLIVQVKEIFTNYGASSSRVADSRYEESLWYRLKTAHTLEGSCRQSNAISKVRCKRGTMNERNVQKLKDNGFDVKSKVVNGRHIVSEISKDGTTIDGNDRKALKTALKKPSFGSSLRSAFNPRTMVFNGGRFSERVLRPLGLDKSRVTLSGNDDEEKKKDFTSKTGGDKTEEDHKRDFEAKHKSKIKSAGKISGRGLGKAAGVACASYNLSRATIGAVKAYNALRFAAFAMLFLKVADQIKTQGEVDPATVAIMGGILTSYKLSGPEKGLTATDSQGFKTAAYGGEGALKDFTRRYMLSGSTKLLLLEEAIKNTQEMAGGKRNVRAACKGVSSLGAQIAGIGFTCLSSGGTGAGLGAAIGTVFPGLGNLIGGGFGALAGCVAGVVAIDWLIGKAVDGLIGLILPKVVAALVDAPIDSNIGGVDAGNALAAGAGLILLKTNMSRGLQPGKKAGVKEFHTALAEDEARYESIARYDARSEPFNVYNEFSFLGSALRSSGLIGVSSPTKILGTLLQSSTNIAPRAFATASMPVSITEKDLDHCPDETLKSIEVDCDAVGGTQFVMAPKVPVESNLDYMIGNYVDEDGNLIDDDSDYAKWIQYCTDEREEPLGVDSGPIEDEDDWKTGAACVYDGREISQATRDHFSTYYYDNAAQEDEEYVPPTTSGSGFGAGSQVRVATYNVLGKSHTDGPSPNSNLPTWSERIVKVVENIQSNNIDVIGFQEFEHDQQQYLDEHLTGYERSKQGKVDDGIMWNTARFTKTAQGTWQSTYFRGAIQEPWVKLKDSSSGQEFYFMNVHDPINKGQGDAQTRYNNAVGHLAKINELKADAPVMIVGDFNNGYRKADGSGMPSDEKTAYCVLSNGGMIDAIDAFKDQNYKCSGNPRPDKGSDIDSNIDHIYVSQGLDVKDYFDINKPQSGSDHVAVIADVIIPGANAGAGTDFIAATYNQPVRGDASKAVDQIRAKKFDVFGMQEQGGNNYFTIKGALKNDGYAVYPSITRDEANSPHCSYARPIYYNTSKFKFIKGEVFDVPSYETTKFSNSYPPYVESRRCGNDGETTKGGGHANIPIAWLQDATTGQGIIVLNTHNIASCCGSIRVAPKKRFEAAQIYVAKIQELKTANPGIPIFFTGDFNEGTGVRRSDNVTYEGKHENLLYCMFKSSSLLFRAAGSPDQPCRTDREPIGRVDYIYATPGTQVKWVREFLDPSTGEDPHHVVYSRLVVPGSAVGGGN